MVGDIDQALAGGGVDAVPPPGRHAGRSTVGAQAELVLLDRFEPRRRDSQVQARPYLRPERRDEVRDLRRLKQQRAEPDALDPRRGAPLRDFLRDEFDELHG